jgi:hypothetical protein
MSQPSSPPPAKLIAGLLFRSASVQQRALSALTENFGPADFATEPEPFTFTRYYEREMGAGLLRQWVAFLHLVPPDCLAAVKLTTNGLEERFSDQGKRAVNIDPGVLSEERVVLATGKNYTHRVYLRDGIYADLTLIFQRGRYRPLPWTYPDYQTPLLLHYFAALRRKLLFQRSGRLIGVGSRLPGGSHDS